ncbi:VOC family protein [Microbacterium sp. cf332]|uniref:VOC family protein n=1 Tax=Microbacterium sp. cf332 TaxID=1761804 RepID=UPI0008915A29|nr:VOC family protein [Microbacterium sp. cf332]SDQ49019.1 PhnB protein [Microbacterium sp. cf332]
MPAPVPYVHFGGDAAEALRFYRSVFGGDLQLHTFSDFGRDDGDADLIAHGELRGAVDLFGADAAAGEDVAPRPAGILLALLGAADEPTSRAWFDALAAGGTVVDPLQLRGWGDYDGQVRDRFGLTWLIGFTPA